jgi:WD40 repeat protein
MYGLNFSSDGRHMASGGYGYATVWDLDNPAHTTQITLSNSESTWDVSAMALSANGRYLALGTSGATRVEVFRISDGTLVQTLNITGRARSQTSGDGQWMKPARRTGPGPYYISDIAFSPDGERLSVATGFGKGSEYIWRTGERLWEADIAPSLVNYSPDGHTLAFESYTVEFRESRTGRVLGRLGNHVGSITDLQFIPGTNLLAIGSRDAQIRLRRLSDGAVYRILSGHSMSVNDIDVSPDGRYLLSGANDRQALLWDLSERTVQQLGEALDWVRHVGLSFDGRMAAFSSFDYYTQLIHIPQNLALNDQFSPMALDFSPSQPYLAISDYHSTVTVYDTADFSIQRVLEINAGWVERLKFSEDGAFLVAAGDETLTIWDIETGAVALELFDLDRLGPFALSADNQLLVTGHYSTIKFWSIRDGVQVHTIPLNIACANTLAFSEQGDRLAIGASDGTVRIWALLP